MCTVYLKQRVQSQPETALYDIPSPPCDKIDTKDNKAYQPTDTITTPKEMELQQNISYRAVGL